jgi:hypothetical protein
VSHLTISRWTLSQRDLSANPASQVTSFKLGEIFSQDQILERFRAIGMSQEYDIETSQVCFPTYMKGKTGLHEVFLQGECLSAQVTFSHGTIPVNTILVLV